MNEVIINVMLVFVNVVIGYLLNIFLVKLGFCIDMVMFVLKEIYLVCKFFRLWYFFFVNLLIRNFDSNY